MYKKNKNKKKTINWLNETKAILVVTAIIFVGLKALTPVTTSGAELKDYPWKELPVAEDRELSVADQIRQMAREHDFEWEDYLIDLAWCESRLKQYATNGKGNSPVGSVDRGLFMVNDYWHSEISDECSFDIRCSTEFTIKMINQGRQSEWVCDRYI